MANVTVKNKKTGKVLNTINDGLFIVIDFNPDCSFAIEEIGICVDNSTIVGQDTIEKYFDSDDYEVISVDI